MSQLDCGDDSCFGHVELRILLVETISCPNPTKATEIVKPDRINLSPKRYKQIISWIATICGSTSLGVATLREVCRTRYPSADNGAFTGLVEMTAWRACLRGTQGLATSSGRTHHVSGQQNRNEDLWPCALTRPSQTIDA